MKCGYCNGTGKSKYGYNQPCTHCDGKGFTEPLTNEEWLRQKSVEELAVFLAMVQLDEYEEPIDSAYVNTWVLWLKEKHE